MCIVALPQHADQTALDAPQGGPVLVAREECSVTSPKGKDSFTVRHGVVTSNQGVTPAASEGKL